MGICSKSEKTLKTIYEAPQANKNEPSIKKHVWKAHTKTGNTWAYTINIPLFVVTLIVGVVGPVVGLKNYFTSWFNTNVEEDEVGLVRAIIYLDV